MRLAATSLAIALLSGCGVAPDPGPPWQPLFDGVSLAGMTRTNYGGEGEVSVVDGQLRQLPGSPLTGIHIEGWQPTPNYQIEVVAARLAGQDFFCGLTFPVSSEHLTLVLGGWGGTVSGISNLDGLDASSNDTRRLRYFENGRFYRILVTVTQEHLDVTIDGEPFLAANLAGRQLGLRAEMEPSRPVGFACFQTEAAVSSLRWRPLADPVE
ncbi:MAG: DUF1080 domain-containing protein [Planctomycetota bacterium]|nr:DUF1080 domain-containing protein [Planctomycetota bacterium]